MKKLFAENPSIRKGDIIGATKMYLYNTDPRFIRFPLLFSFQKGAGASKINDILSWIDKYKLVEDQQNGRTSYSNTIK